MRLLPLTRFLAMAGSLPLLTAITMSPILTELAPGEENTVEFELTKKQMSFINEEGQRMIKPGTFKVFLGGSQPDERSLELTATKVEEATFEVMGNMTKLEY